LKELKGIIAPIPTAFDESQELALDPMAGNLERMGKSRLAGFAILGSTGEFVYLTPEEKKAVLERARQVIPEEKIMLAGTGSESTRETIHLTRWAGELGADFAMVVTPAYYKRAMKPEVLRAHYLEVADQSPLPVVLYNVPIFTMVNLGAGLVAELSSHPNIVGIKDSAGDMLQLQEICRLTPDDFSVVTGAGSLLLASLTLGARGAILAVANVAYDLCVDLLEAFTRGDLARARQIQHRLVPINRAVTTEYGIAGLKYILEQQGLYGGPPRAPLRRPGPDVQDQLMQILAKSLDVEVSPS
jgi:4-hydroxy-2-oxoglutarate aldolase